MMIDQRRIDIPSYVVTVEEEGQIRFAPGSSVPVMLGGGEPVDDAPGEEDAESADDSTEAAAEPSR